jgi:thiamine monophosphate synthase
MNKIFYKHYVFLDELNTLLKKKLLKFKNINIIINIEQNDKKNLQKQDSIVQFAKKNKIPFLFKNSFQKCTKHNACGIFIDSKNKKITKPHLFKKNFAIIGSAHNQLEYIQKLNQGCSIIMLSPIFYNPKFSHNKILNLIKFNLISKNWKIKIGALGGVMYEKKNLKKISQSKAMSIGFSRFHE